MSSAEKDDRVKYTQFYKDQGYVELHKTFPEEQYLWNEDFHPTPLKLRRWGSWTFFAVWFGMAVEVESWALVSIGYSFGLDWFWSLFAVIAGNVIVLVPMIIQAHGGSRYGISETPLTRSRWGLYGNWIPSVLRGVIGAGWWGIDTWIIAECVGAIYLVSNNQLGSLFASVQNGTASPFTIATVVPTLFWATFLATIAVRLLILYYSPPKTGQRTLQIISWTVPFIGFLGFGILFFTMMNITNWQWTAILNSPMSVSGSAFWYALIGLINANVAFWATMAISMPDFTRYAKSQFSQTVGQIPLPLLMGGIGVLGLVTTGASLVHYGVPIWDPVLLAALAISSQPLAYLTILLLLLGVIVVNVYADTIGPGYDFSNLYPKKISWFAGVVIVVIIAGLLQSWSYYFSAQSYVENWLLTYGALLGGVEGIIVFDYSIIRRFKFEVYDLFYSKGRFRYFRGVNPAAVISFAIAMILVFPPNTYIGPDAAMLYPGQGWVFQNAWVSAILITGIIYIVLMAAWVLPKYQPELKGSLLKGYIADDTAVTFGVSTGAPASAGQAPAQAQAATTQPEKKEAH